MSEEPPQGSAETPDPVDEGKSLPSSPPPEGWPLLPPGRDAQLPQIGEGSLLRPGAQAASPDFAWLNAIQREDYISRPWTPPTAPETEKKTRTGIRVGRLARDLIETVILALLIFVGVRAMVQNFRVEGSSMEGSLHNGQYILVNKATYFKVDLSFLNFLPFFDAGDNPVHYIFGGPGRGDVVVFRFPNQPERDFIKRVIGLPGDQVEIKDGLVFVNGHALDEPYELERPTHDYGPVVVPEGQYFVLGDNRNNSYDSRSWGFVPEDDIVGKAWLSYWPFSEFGMVSDPHVVPLGTQGTTP